MQLSIRKFHVCWSNKSFLRERDVTRMKLLPVAPVIRLAARRVSAHTTSRAGSSKDTEVGQHPLQGPDPRPRRRLDHQCLARRTKMANTAQWQWEKTARRLTVRALLATMTKKMTPYLHPTQLGLDPLLPPSSFLPVPQERHLRLVRTRYSPQRRKSNRETLMGPLGREVQTLKPPAAQLTL